MVDMAHIAGLVAGGVHPSPVPYADFVTTTTHKTLAGPRGGLILTNDEALAKKVNSAVFPGTQGGPLMHVIGAKAVCFKEALSENYKKYQQQVVKNTKAFATALAEHDIDMVSGGSDNHLILINLIKHKLTGKQVANLLDEFKITCNKNGVPNDPQSPFVTSGIRVGTAAMTRRGFTEADFRDLGELIAKFIISMSENAGQIDEQLAKNTHQKVQELTDSLDFYKQSSYV
jgi:glycine hydroxymethyltransferase